MNKNLIWKFLLIVVLVALAGLLVWPPQDKLKPGLDLAGGTSLVYEIDTSDMARGERKDLAARMIPILRRRIDPTNVANLVIRPQGDTRIEIQLPVASEDTKQKRRAFEDALEQLEKENLNLMRVKRALTMSPEERNAVFAEFAGTSQERREILDELARTYDARREMQDQRDTFEAQLDEIGKQIESAGLDTTELQTNALEWSKLGQAQLNEKANSFVEDVEKEGLVESLLKFGKPKARELVVSYVKTYGKWADVVNRLAEPETGLNAQFSQAAQKLNDLNLSTEQMMSILQMPKDSPARNQNIEQIKERFPQRAAQIEAVVQAYDTYSKVGGRLDDPEDLKRMLKGSGVLEFRIVPTMTDTDLTSSEIQAYQEALMTRGPKMASDSEFVWKEIENQDPQYIRQNWMGTNFVIGQFGDKYYVLASNQPNEVMLHRGQKPWKLKKAYPTTDSQTMRPAIGFDLDDSGGNLFFNLTQKNIGRHLAIFLDDLALNAPTIQSAIRTTGQITGKYTQVELENMINKLNAGSFPARLSEVPISEKTIGPALGADNRDQGIRAGLIGLGAVAVFMILYYLFPGFVADIALLMNIVFILAMMVAMRGTFTLPGIAGIILTIGMSVDANVLIFERIREEQMRGNSLKQAIANGYGRAFRTIFDANVTTFITALILYAVASEEIKGFAIVLMLGIISSLFTALFVTRVVFDFLVDRKVLRDHMTMQLWIKNATINWMGMRPVFLVVSGVLLLSGIAIFVTRDEKKNSKYDIEFTGGTSVQINLKEGTNFSRAVVEERIREEGQKAGNPALMAAKVYSVGESGREFEITTTATNKTTAQVNYTQGEHSVESVTKDIRRAADKIGRTLYNLEVTQTQPNVFSVSTSQVNKGLVNEVLTSAVEETGTVTPPHVDEVVTQAVRDAFGDYLDVREDLGVTITETVPVDESDVELADYIGGYKFHSTLNEETTAGELRERFRDIRFKPDAQELNWYRYELFGSDILPVEDSERLKAFVYVSVHPEAGYRELSSDENERFIANEETKIRMACSLETSLARVTQIDPSVGAQSQTRAMIAIVLSLIAIVGYVWIRFGNAAFGFAAIAALVHDVCITLGAVAACTYIAGTPVGDMLGIGDFKINLEMIAAFLTIIGYSLNDTIVVFDRIRENRGKMAILTPEIITGSINQTLSRTLLTSFTTFLAVLVMYIWGGAGLRGFTFAMLIGIIIGTYSSIAIASPILLLGHKKNSSK